jgi:hypothetical protein
MLSHVGITFTNDECDPITGNADGMAERSAYFKGGKQMKGLPWDTETVRNRI